MSEEANKAIVRRYFEEVWNRGNLAVADLIIAPNFSVEGCGGAISGLEAVKLYVSSYRAACPNVHFTILSLTAEGDKVAACWVGRGLLCDASACEEAATPQQHPSTGLSVYRIAGGQIAEAWAGSDHSGTDAEVRLGITRNGQGGTT